VGATIYYTRDAAITSATKWTAFLGDPIVLTATGTIYAKAAKSGMPESAVVSATYTIIPKVATPKFVTNLPGSYRPTVTITLACETPNAAIYYTLDGSDPVAIAGSKSKLYTAGFILSASAIVRARAFVTGLPSSDILDGEFGVGGDGYESDDTPAQASLIAGGQVQTHSIHYRSDVDWVKFTLTTKSSIRLQTNGMAGDTEMWLYDAQMRPIDYDDNGWNRTFSLISRTDDKALDANTTANPYYYVKVQSKGNKSTIAAYTLSFQASGVLAVATPVLTPAIMANSVKVTISCSTPGATIRYTTDGSRPTLNSPIYTMPMMFYTTVTLNVISFKAGMISSSMNSATYIIARSQAEFVGLPDGVTLTSTPTATQWVGAPVTLTATTCGGSAMSYAFYIGTQDHAGNWTYTLLQSSAAPTCTWIPQVAGAYRLLVSTQQAGTPACVETAMAFTVVESQ